MRRALGVVAVAALLASCGEAPPPETCPGGQARWYEDRDGDGIGDDPVTVCPADRPEGLVPLGGDCAPDDPAAFLEGQGFVDADGDGFGSGAEVTVCTNVAGLRSLADRAGDCAPDDPARWRRRAFASRDADGDGVAVPAGAEAVCVGAAIPPGYSEDPPPRAPDCDDADPERSVTHRGFTDADGDGFGAGPEVERCAGARRPRDLAERDGDCDDGSFRRFATVAYTWRDADGDGATVPEQGQLCTDGSLPPGYLNEPGPEDCDDMDRAVSALRPAYRDEDGDGVGAGPLLDACIPDPPPRGWSASGSDCAPARLTRYQELAYRFRDADGDGVFAEVVPDTVCSGRTLPAGYADVAPLPPLDCDDANPRVFVNVAGFPDVDGDGVGAPPGRAECTDGRLPAGTLATFSDCAPSDPAAWQTLRFAAVDRDGDGWSVPNAGQLCGGARLPAPFLAAMSDFDCDDADASRFALTLLFDDLDRDGVGAGPSYQRCLGVMLPAATSLYGDDPDDTDPAVSEDRELEALILLHL